MERPLPAPLLPHDAEVRRSLCSAFEARRVAAEVLLRRVWAAVAPDSCE